MYKTQKTLVDDERRGTTAFMSYELLTGMPYRPPEPSLADFMDQEKGAGVPAQPMPGIKHDAIHDLESFFWVLCWICLTREGPGRSRETWSDSPAQTNAMKAVIKDVYEKGDPAALANEKLKLLGSAGNWTNIIWRSTAPYFHPLSRYLFRLRQLLWETYASRDFDRIHEDFLAILTEAEASDVIQTWHGLHPEYQGMEVAEKMRRNAELRLFESPQAERVTSTGVLATSHPETTVEEDEDQREEYGDVTPEEGEEDSSPSACRGRKVSTQMTSQTRTTSRTIRRQALRQQHEGHQRGSPRRGQ
ncbi:hypothetical protein DENSPDRAFT_853289 [Dentipellis sp. KUC8613]|nr:hypothetical protein DENSPDRAFT_853289 [Dentipellis sp. KUC8613]